MKFETKAIHRGQEPDRETGAVIPPIYATSTFAQESPGNTKGYDYTRSGNPNFTRLGQTLAALEKAKYATVFSSGVAAITAVVSTLKKGDMVLAEENIYGRTYRLFARVFEKFGVDILYADIPKVEREKVGITDGLVRFSLGIEHIDDLIDDCSSALDALGLTQK